MHSCRDDYCLPWIKVFNIVSRCYRQVITVDACQSLTKSFPWCKLTLKWITLDCYEVINEIWVRVRKRIGKKYRVILIVKFICKSQCVVSFVILEWVFFYLIWKVGNIWTSSMPTYTFLWSHLLWVYGYFHPIVK